MRRWINLIAESSFDAVDSKLAALTAKAKSQDIHLRVAACQDERDKPFIDLEMIQRGDAPPGAGGEIMNELCAIADHFRMPIELYALGADPKLMAYYERFAFATNPKKNDEAWMIRQPKSSSSRLTESATTISIDDLPLSAKQDIIDMLLTNCAPFERYWMKTHGVMSFIESYVSQNVFGTEDLAHSKEEGYGDGQHFRVAVFPIDPNEIDNSRRSVSDSQVGKYAALSTAPPPILVVKTARGWRIAEGGHRLAAAKQNGAKTIIAVDVSVFFRTNYSEVFESQSLNEDQGAPPIVTFDELAKHFKTKYKIDLYDVNHRRKSLPFFSFWHFLLYSNGIPMQTTEHQHWKIVPLSALQVPEPDHEQKARMMNIAKMSGQDLPNISNGSAEAAGIIEKIAADYGPNVEIYMAVDR